MIRKAYINDVHSAFLLMKQLSSHESTFHQFWHCFSSNLNNSIVYVKEIETQVVGMIVLNVHYPLHFCEKVMEITNLIVDEKIRGNGVGGELLTAARQEGEALGCIRLEVASGGWRKNAHRFYEREGFLPTHVKLIQPLNKEGVECTKYIQGLNS